MELQLFGVSNFTIISALQRGKILKCYKSMKYGHFKV